MTSINKQVLPFLDDIKIFDKQWLHHECYMLIGKEKLYADRSWVRYAPDTEVHCTPCDNPVHANFTAKPSVTWFDITQPV